MVPLLDNSAARSVGASSATKCEASPTRKRPSETGVMREAAAKRRRMGSLSGALLTVSVRCKPPVSEGTIRSVTS